MSSRDRGALSGALAGPAFVAAVAGAMGMSSEPYPRPGADAEAVRRFFGQRPSPMLVSAPGQLISGAALGRFAVSIAGLARGSGPLRAAALAGGPVHGAGFGLLLGALGAAGLRTGELSRPLARAATVAAVPNLLSPLALVAPPAAWLIPVGRFPGLVVCGIAGRTLASG